MRALTFKGYILSQLQELSGVGGTSLYSFSKLAENNFRLKDALCLYLMMFTDNNSDYLQKARKYGHFTGYKN